jgi:hypothetical protein
MVPSAEDIAQENGTVICMYLGEGTLNLSSVIYICAQIHTVPAIHMCAQIQPTEFSCDQWATVHRQNVEVTNAESTKRRTTKRRKTKRRMGQNVDWKKRRMVQKVEWKKCQMGQKAEWYKTSNGKNV